MAQSSPQWMVRTHDNQIVGPYLPDQVKALIIEGRLLVQDEICPANGYWFYLHESAELQSQLGVQMPRSSLANAEEEITDTQTEVSVSVSASGDDGFDGAPELEATAEDLLSEDTKILSNRALREFRSPKKPSAPSAPPRELATAIPSAPRVHVRGEIEKPQAWRYFVLVLLAAAGALLYWMLDLLRR